MQLNIHGIPPKPNMADVPPVPDDHLSETTLGELEAGRKALTENEKRKNAEQEAGRKAIAHLQRSAPSHSESEEE